MYSLTYSYSNGWFSVTGFVSMFRVLVYAHNCSYFRFIQVILKRGVNGVIYL